MRGGVCLFNIICALFAESGVSVHNISRRDRADNQLMQEGLGMEREVRLYPPDRNRCPTHCPQKIDPNEALDRGAEYKLPIASGW